MVKHGHRKKLLLARQRQQQRLSSLSEAKTEAAGEADTSTAGLLLGAVEQHTEEVKCDATADPEPGSYLPRAVQAATPSATEAQSLDQTSAVDPSLGAVDPTDMAEAGLSNPAAISAQ